MKRRKILVVIPALGLLLTGCSFQEGFTTAKHWIGQNIYHPVKDWIDGLMGKKEEPTPEPEPGPVDPDVAKPVEITEVRAPESIEQDATLDPASVPLSVKYSDGTTKTHAATDVKLDTSTVAQDVEGTAYYNDLSKAFTIDVVAKSETNYGDEDHPLTTTQALAIIQKECTADKSFTKQRIFVEGEISEVKTKDFGYDSGPCSELTITDGTTPVHVYRVHMSAELNAHVLVGSTIKLNGFGKLNGEDYQFADNSKEQCVATSVVEKTGEDPVESVAFDSATYEVQVGKTQVVHATVSPATAVNKDVVYTLENVSPEGCVTIEGDVITGVAVGTATIKATTVSGEKTNTATVNVVPGLNYGTLENPLTIAEAKALLDKENPAKETMYITGRINSNKAYSTQYNNTEIWLGESSNEFELFGCNLPENFAPAQPVENDPALVGKVVVVSGTGKIYTKNNTYELDKGCKIEKFVEEPTKEIKSFGEVTGLPTEVYVGGSINVSSVNIAVTYTDDTQGTVHPTDIQFDNSVEAQNVALHVMYGNDEVGAGLYTVNVVPNAEVLTPLADVYAAGVAAGTSESTEEYTYQGVVTGKQGNSYYIQNGGDGMYIYNNSTINPSVGNVVKIKSTVTSYNNSPQSKTVKEASVVEESGTMPTPLSIGGLSDIGNAHVLASVAKATFKSKDYNWSSSKASLAVFRIGSDDITVKFDKYGYDEAKATILNGATEGDEFVLDNVLTAINNTTKQLGFAGTSTIQKVEKTIASIGTVTGPSSEIPLNGTVEKSDVSVQVNYEGGGSGYGKVTSVDASTTTSGEQQGTVTIEGWAEPIAFTYTVASAPTQDVVYNKVVADQTDWSGIYILVNDSAAKAWTGVDASECGQAVTITNDSITNPSDTVVQLEIATQGSGYSIKLLGGDKKGNYIDGKLSSGKEANGIYFSSNAVELSITYETGDSPWVKITGSSGQVMRYNDAASNGNWFRFYKSTTYTAQQPVQLYKLAA